MGSELVSQSCTDGSSAAKGRPASRELGMVSSRARQVLFLSQDVYVCHLVQACFDQEVPGVCLGSEPGRGTKCRQGAADRSVAFAGQRNESCQPVSYQSSRSRRAYRGSLASGSVQYDVEVGRRRSLSPRRTLDTSLQNICKLTSHQDGTQESSPALEDAFPAAFVLVGPPGPAARPPPPALVPHEHPRPLPSSNVRTSGPLRRRGLRITHAGREELSQQGYRGA